MSADTYTRAIQVSEVPPGTKRAVEIAGKSVLICNANGRIHAVSNICSHAEEKLELGRLGNAWIACPVHGARFDLVTGRAKNPPATRPIAVYAVRITDDWVELSI